MKEVVNKSWNEITKEELSYLFYEEGKMDWQIGEMYNVSKNVVKSKRDKWNIKNYNPRYKYRLLKKYNPDLFENLNNDAKERLMGEENIDWISKALTHYIFRNGPVEDMHADGKLSQEDMKILNKYMVDKIAGLLKLINDGDYLKIELMLEALKYYGTEWDPARYDIDEINMIFENMI